MPREILITTTKLDDYSKGITGELTLEEDLAQVTLQDTDWQIVGGEMTYDTLVFSNERIVRLRDFLNQAIDILKKRGVL